MDSRNLFRAYSWCCLLAGVCTEIHAQNLLINGSFEEGPNLLSLPNIPLNPGSIDIPGWIVTRGQIDYAGNEWVACDGERTIDLDGSPGFGGIKQTFRTFSNHIYKVTFCFAGNPCTQSGPEIKRMRVSAAGQAMDFSFSVRGRNFNDMDWTTDTWEFLSNSSVTELEFLSLDLEGGYCGPTLDNVSVILVAPSFIRGDANQDGFINIADPIISLEHLFLGDVVNCLDALDVNNDNQVDISDPIGLLEFLFLGAIPPSPPFPGCGLDSEDGNLGCDFFNPCE